MSLMPLHCDPPFFLVMEYNTFGDRISENKSIYVGLTLITLSRRLTMHISVTRLRAQNVKVHSYPITEFRKILTGNTGILEL